MKEELEDLLEESIKKALSKLMYLLSRREYCIYDVEHKLRKWGIEQEAWSGIISILIKNRYLSNERYVKAYIRDKFEINRLGERRIRSFLSSKKIEKDLIDRELSFFFEDNTETLANLDILLQKKIKTIKERDVFYKVKEKLVRFGVYRGYDYDSILTWIEKNQKSF